MPQNTTDNDTRTVKASEVKQSDHVFDRAGAPVEVTHIQPFTRRTVDHVLIVTADGDSTEYELGDPVHIVSRAKLAEMREAAERPKKIAEMRGFLDWLEQHPEMPVPYMGHHQAYPAGDWDEQVAAVRQIAEQLGVAARVQMDDDREVASLNYRVGGGVTYSLYAWRPKPSDPQPEPETPEHYEAGGWKGGGEKGGCGVECACGTTFDGFDSLAEAAALLARHIEEGNAADAHDGNGPVVHRIQTGGLGAACGEPMRLIDSAADDPDSVTCAACIALESRGTDAAETHQAKPADVEGHGHQRGATAFTDEPATEPALTTKERS